MTDTPLRDGVEMLSTADGWHLAIDFGGVTRAKAPGADEATKLVDLSKRSTGAQLTL